MDYTKIFLVTISMFSGYVYLLPVRMSRKYYALLFLYFFSLYCWITPHIGQIGTFFFIFGGSLIIYFGCQRSVLNVILALTGHLLVILVDHIYTIPLSYMGVSFASLLEKYPIFYMLTIIISNILVLMLFKKYMIAPKLDILQTCPGKLLFLFFIELLLGLSLLTFNFIYGESVGYPARVLSMNGSMIAILTLSAILVFYAMYDILMKNHELMLRQTQAEIMQDYTTRMESFYDEIRIFRHDYRNILATMQDYIDHGNIEELQKYFHDRILADTTILSDDGFFLGKLHLIENHAVKSLLYTKLITILNHNLSLTLELTERVSDIPIDSLLLCRVLGILLDNAIEASLASKDRRIQLAIVCTEHATTFIVANSTPPLQVPVAQLCTQGYSTKGKHKGIGLYAVRKMLDPIPNVSLCTEYQDNTFRQTLEICSRH